MAPSRRTFLGLATAWAAALAVGAAARPQQSGNASSPDPRSEDPFEDSDPTGPGPKFNPRQLLEANQKGIKKDVARLSEIVQDLQKQLDDKDTKDTKDILSLDVLRRTDEIERLAKHIRSLVRG